MVASFKHALAGIWVAFREHPNFRVHTVIAVFVVIVSLLFQITRMEFIIIIFTINLVFITEMINTSVEEITNLITIKWAQQAKLAKDVAAGMTLITAISAVIVGLIIFIPYILNLLT